jgi:hypothetical protein
LAHDLAREDSHARDAELRTLLANARRLDITGTPDQRRAVAEVITPLEREASRRRAAARAR